MTLFRRFKENTNGSVATIFGLAALPLVGVAGAVIDYTRASAAHADMQRAVDATALALVREAGRLGDNQLQKRGQTIFGGLYQSNAWRSAEPIKVQRTAKTIRVSAAGSVQTTLVGVMGFKQMGISTDAEVAWGAKKIELALVLDNTGSMGKTVNGVSKIEALKTASRDLLDTLFGATSETGAIKVSIVPFNTQVRLNTAETGANPYWIGFTGGITPTSWKGYVEDRMQPFDATDAEPRIAQPDTLHPAAVRAYAPDLAPIQPLTSVRAGLDALRDTVKAMQPTGNTNITIGVAWGLATLSDSKPLTGGAAFGAPDVEKVMIVLTDGDNTQSRIYDRNGLPKVNLDASKIDARTRAACDEAKTPAKNVTVIAIRVVEGNEALLKNCASKPTDPKHPFYRNGESLYHDVQNPADLKPLFQAIVNQILATRLTH